MTANPETVEVSKELFKRFVDAQSAIDNFCDKSDLADEAWRNQPHIAALFKMRSGECLQ